MVRLFITGKGIYWLNEEKGSANTKQILNTLYTGTAFGTLPDENYITEGMTEETLYTKLKNILHRKHTKQNLSRMINQGLVQKGD